MRVTLCVVLATLGWVASLVAEEVVKLGMSAAFSGPSAALGNEMRRGANVYFDVYNRRNVGQPLAVSLTTKDDGYEPVRTINNVRQFIEEDGVFALFGFVGTPTAQVAVPIAERAKTPFFAPFTGAEFLRQPVKPYVFNVRASYRDETRRIVDYIADTLKLRSVAMLIQDDAFGTAGREGVEAAIKAKGLPEAPVAKYARNTLDVDAAVAQLKTTSAQAVVMVGTYAPCALFIKKARAVGFSPRFFVLSFVGTQAFIEALGDEGYGVVVAQVMPSPVFSTLPIVEDYRQAMAAAGESQLDYGSLEGYVAARVFGEMVSRTPLPLTPEGFVHAVELSGTMDLGGLALSFGPDDHQGLDAVYLTEIRDGQAIPLDERPIKLSDDTTRGGDSVQHPMLSK